MNMVVYFLFMSLCVSSLLLFDVHVDAQTTPGNPAESHESQLVQNLIAASEQDLNVAAEQTIEITQKIKEIESKIVKDPGASARQKAVALKIMDVAEKTVDQAIEVID